MVLSAYALYPAEIYIANNWQNYSSNFAEKHVFSRFCHLGLIPWSPITTAVDTVIGAVTTVGALLTLGAHYQTFNFTERQLETSKFIIARPYLHLLQTINPQAECFDHYSIPDKGFFTNWVCGKLANEANMCAHRDNSVFMKYIISRLSYLLLIVAAVVSRAVDLAIGLLAACFSIITLGCIPAVNNVAYRALQAPGVIHDVIIYTIRVINPWAGNP